jgi:hypothetical protein
MKAQTMAVQSASFWQRVFLRSKVNGAAYSEDCLSGTSWNWPENTFLQRRLEHVRQCRSSGFADVHQIEA